MKHKGNITQLVSIEEIGIRQGGRVGSIWCLNMIAERIDLTKALVRTSTGLCAKGRKHKRTCICGDVGLPSGSRTG